MLRVDRARDEPLQRIVEQLEQELKLVGYHHAAHNSLRSMVIDWMKIIFCLAAAF